MSDDAALEIVSPGKSAARRPTIRDVARVAGVSYATVSRYLNGRKWVGTDSANAIVRAIDETGYRTNRFARSLATGRSLTVAFLLTEPQDRLFGDPNYPVLLREITLALADRGYTLILMTASTDGERARVMDFVAGHVDGVLLVSSHVGDPILELLDVAHVPTISCGRPMGWDDRISSVSADDREGAKVGTAHLIASGRRRIAAISGPLDLGGAADRLDGYYAALDEAGISRDSALVDESDWTHAGGRASMQRLLERNRDIDALFAGNDAMALGAIATLRANGLRVPEDVAVVGFDDSGLAVTSDPPLTTLRQPFQAISGEMVRMLCDGLPEHPVTERIPAELVVRESAPGPSATR